jgi:nucleoside-diphosphate-sugar epimerase
MKIILTGISSFIGVHLTKLFRQQGHDIVGIISRNINEYDGIRSQRLSIVKDIGVKILRLDITDHDAISSIIQKEKPEIWIHHAGWAESYGSMDYDIDKGHRVNVTPLKKLFSSLAEISCKGIILTGSSAEYSDSDSACKEDDACWPATPYGLSKLSETIRARQLSEQYNIRTRIARVFIPFGPLDAPQKLIPSVVQALKTKTSVDLSACEQRRDFIYVEDLVTGYEALLNDLDRNINFDVFNLCSGNATRLKDLLSELIMQAKGDSRLLNFGARPMREGETPVSYGSNDKARDVLGWVPRPLGVGLKSYLEEENF